MKKQLAILTALAISLSGLSFVYAAPTDMKSNDSNITAEAVPSAEVEEGVGKKIEKGVEHGYEKTKEELQKGGQHVESGAKKMEKGVEHGYEKTKEGLQKGGKHVEEGVKKVMPKSNK